MRAYLPVFGVALKHHRVFGLADFPTIFVLDVLYILGGLDAIILGESALVALLQNCVSNRLA